MPAFVAEPTIADEPEAHDPTLPNPAFDDSNLKAIAEKFRANWQPKPEARAGDGDANKTGTSPVVEKPTGSGKEAGDSLAKKDPGIGAGGTPTPTSDPEDVPEPKPNEPVTRDHFKRLAQSRDAFKQQATKLKEEREAAATRAAQLEAELNKTKAALPPNLEEVQKAIADSKRIAEENKRISEELEVVNLERHPRFQSWWKTETGKHIKVAQAHVPVAEREAIEKLLMEPATTERDEKLTKIIDALPSVGQRMVNGAMEAIEKLRIEREEALTRGSARWKELQAHEQEEKAKSAQAKQQQLQAMSDAAVAHCKAYSAFQPTGDAAADAEIPQREAFVRACVAGRVDKDIMLNLPAISVEYLHLTEKVVPGLKAEIAKQAELIKQLQGGSVRASDGKSGGAAGGAGGGGGKAENKDGTSFAQRVKELYQGKSP